jgi:DtxR family manganese transport transcriptional regulator
LSTGFPFSSGSDIHHLVARPAKTHPAPHAVSLQRTRKENVEMIADLIAATGEARVTDLARCLGVTHVTVNRTIQRLQRNGLVTAQPYRSIFLTTAGRTLSEESRRRHRVVAEFLESLGVPADIAHTDAEGMEHHVSKETLAAFVRHLARRG